MFQPNIPYPSPNPNPNHWRIKDVYFPPRFFLSFSFICMEFSDKMPIERMETPVWEIVDPPLDPHQYLALSQKCKVCNICNSLITFARCNLNLILAILPVKASNTFTNIRTNQIIARGIVYTCIGST